VRRGHRGPGIETEFALVVRRRRHGGQDGDARCGNVWLEQVADITNRWSTAGEARYLRISDRLRGQISLPQRPGSPAFLGALCSVRAWSGVSVVAKPIETYGVVLKWFGTDPGRCFRLLIFQMRSVALGPA
jgi:hypothetical protein